MASDQLNVKIVVDSSSLTTGMSQASSTVTAASSQMASALKTADSAATRMAISLKAGGLAATEAASALKNLGFSAAESASAMSAAGFSANTLAAKTTATATAMTGMDRAMAMASGRIAGMGVGAGMLGGALGRIGAQSAALAPVLAAAFPILLVGAFIGILDQAWHKLRELEMEGLANAEAWQKINHESAAADEAIEKSIEHLKVKLTELTQGHLAALRMEMKQIGDGSVEMAGKMMTLFDNIGTQIQKEMPMFDKVKEFVNFVSSHGIIMPNQGELAKAFGADLAKTLDKDGLAAGIEKVGNQIRIVNEELAKTPNNKALAEYADQLIKVQALLEKRRNEERLQGEVNTAEQTKELTKEQMHAAEQALAYSKALERLKLMQEGLAISGNSLALSQSKFGDQISGEAIKRDTASFSERLNAEIKFNDDREADAKQNALAEVAIEQKKVQELQRIGTISEGEAIRQLNDLEKKKRDIELAYLDARAKDIQARLLTDDAKAYAADLSEWSKLLSAKQKAEEQYNLALQKNDNAAATARNKVWEKSFQTINQTFDRAITGMISGQQRLSVAFAQLGARLIESIAGTLATMALKWAEHYILVNILQKSHIAQEIADRIAGNTAKHAVDAASNVATVTGDAAVGAAATFASVLEALPFPANVAAAPGAAAAMFASIESFAPIASAAGGMVVPEDMLSMVHKNEMVLPAHIAQPLTSAVKGGGGFGGESHVHAHFTIHAVDSSGFEKLLHANQDAIVATITRAMRRKNL